MYVQREVDTFVISLVVFSTNCLRNECHVILIYVCTKFIFCNVKNTTRNTILRVFFSVQDSPRKVRRLNTNITNEKKEITILIYIHMHGFTSGS